MVKFDDNTIIDIIEADLKRGDLRSLLAHLRCEHPSLAVIAWLADRIDPDIMSGLRFVMKKPRGRPSVSANPRLSGVDRTEEIARAIEALDRDPSDLRPRKEKVAEVATRFGITGRAVYRSLQMARSARLEPAD